MRVSDQENEECKKQIERGGERERYRDREIEREMVCNL